MRVYCGPEAGQQAVNWGRMLKADFLNHKHEVERGNQGNTWLWNLRAHMALKPQSPHGGIYFLQHGHTSKIYPNPLPIGEHLSPWKTLSVKPSQSSYEKASLPCSTERATNHWAIPNTKLLDFPETSESKTFYIYKVHGFRCFITATEDRLSPFLLTCCRLPIN